MKAKEKRQRYQELIMWYDRFKSSPKIHEHAEYDEICALTPFLDTSYDNILPKQRIWHIKNNDFEIQKCKICGKPTVWNNRHCKYTLTCGKMCRISYANTSEWRDSFETTCLERYGVKNSSQLSENKQKAKKTCLEKYGVENYTQTPEWKEKLKQTSLKKYGVQNYTQTKEYEHKVKKTCLEKYGVDSYTKTEMAKQNHIRNSKWYRSLQQGIGQAVYLENLDGGKHLVECKICGQKFKYDTKTGTGYNRIIANHTLCPVCNPVEKFYSQAEKELLSFISLIYSGEIRENTKSVIPPYEVDIFLPDFDLAFEFNGLYYHSDLQKPDDYHKIKTELCEQAGVRLVHIFGDDWNYKRSIVESIISNIICPQNNQRIQARKCGIKEVNLSKTNDFLEQNHIQGGVLVQTCCYGLYCDDSLISLMSFKKNKSGFELQRYGILLGHTIVGGAEKLWSHFIKNHNPQIVITYADISLFTGKVYQKLGFQKIRRNRPNYMFVDGDHRIPKQSIRKLKQGYVRQNDPYPRIYNCGIDKWEWKPKKMCLII